MTLPNDEYANSDNGEEDDMAEEPQPGGNPYVLRLDYVWPVFYLLGLRSLFLRCCDIENAAKIFANRSRACHN